MRARRFSPPPRCCRCSACCSRCWPSVRPRRRRRTARRGGRRTVLVTAPLAAVGLLVVALAGGTVVALAGTLLLAVGQGFAVPGLGLLALAGVSAERQGAAAGLFFAFFDAGVGLGGPLAGVVARLATPQGALAAAAGAVLVAGGVGARARSWPAGQIAARLR